MKYFFTEKPNNMIGLIVEVSDIMTTMKRQNQHPHMFVIISPHTPSLDQLLHCITSQSHQLLLLCSSTFQPPSLHFKLTLGPKAKVPSSVPSLPWDSFFPFRSQTSLSSNRPQVWIFCTLNSDNIRPLEQEKKEPLQQI